MADSQTGALPFATRPVADADALVGVGIITHADAPITHSAPAGLVLTATNRNAWTVNGSANITSVQVTGGTATDVSHSGVLTIFAIGADVDVTLTGSNVSSTSPTFTVTDGDVAIIPLFTNGAGGTWYAVGPLSYSDILGTPSVEGTAILSTGEVGGNKVLTEDGVGGSSWVTLAGGGNAQTANSLAQFAATTSLQLRGVLSDETGDGLAYFQNGELGTPLSGDLQNCTGLPTSGLAAGTAWRVVYKNASGVMTELALGASGTFLRSNGATAAPDFASPAGSGDFVGPASSVDNAIMRFDGTTGKLGQNSAVTIADTTGNMAGVGTINTHAIPVGSTPFVTTGATQTLTAKTLTTPTISSFTNAAHTHTNAAGGGQLSITGATTGTLTVARGGTNLTTVAANTVLQSTATDVVTATAFAASTLSGRRATGNVGAITYANVKLDLGIVTPNSPQSTGYAITAANSVNSSTSPGAVITFSGTTNTVNLNTGLGTYAAAEPLEFVVWNLGSGILTVAGSATRGLPTGKTAVVKAGGMCLMRQSATNVFSLAGELVAA